MQSYEALAAYFSSKQLLRSALCGQIHVKLQLTQLVTMLFYECTQLLQKSMIKDHFKFIFQT